MKAAHTIENERLGRVLHLSHTITTDRTGGRTLTGFEVEDLRHVEGDWIFTHESFFKRRLEETQTLLRYAAENETTDQLAKVIVEAIDILFRPMEMMKAELYGEVANSLNRKIGRLPQPTLANDVEKFESEGEEPKERITGFLKMLKSMPAESRESPASYMEEEADSPEAHR